VVRDHVEADQLRPLRTQSRELKRITGLDRARSDRWVVSHIRMLIDSICLVSRAENSGIHRMREIEGHSGTCETDDENRRRLVDRNVSGFPAGDATRRNEMKSARWDNRELARRDASRILYEARSELSKLASSSEARRNREILPRLVINAGRNRISRGLPRTCRIRARAACMPVIPRRGNDVRPTQAEILIRHRDALCLAEHAASTLSRRRDTRGNGRDFLRTLLGRE